MTPLANASQQNKAELYRELASHCDALIRDEPDPIANMANCAALIFHALPDINWAGFYLQKDGELVLGPFQGQPACVRIPVGKGVCGTAAEKHAILRVADVTKFEGHIACDSASRSEIVLPLVNKNSGLIGVLDIDSPELNRFDVEDEAGLSIIAELIGRKL